MVSSDSMASKVCEGGQMTRSRSRVQGRSSTLSPVESGGGVKQLPPSGCEGSMSSGAGHLRVKAGGGRTSFQAGAGVCPKEAKRKG